MKVVIEDSLLRARVERALLAAEDLQRKGALPPVLGDLLLLLGEGGDLQGAPAAPAALNVTEAIIRTLSGAEERLEFVALSFLRDTLIPEATSLSAGAAAMAIHESIRDGLLLTDRIENPRNAKRPTTTVRLNRAHPMVQELAPDVAVARHFEPIAMPGAPLSSTVSEDRR